MTQKTFSDPADETKFIRVTVEDDGRVRLDDAYDSIRLSRPLARAMAWCILWELLEDDSKHAVDMRRGS